VDTITSSKQLVSRAVSIEYFIIGCPWKDLIFFRDILLLPPLAGIKANALI